MSRPARAACVLACAVACALLAAGCGAREAEDRPPPVMRVAVAHDGLLPEVATGVATGPGRVLTVAHALAGARGVSAGGQPARVVLVDRRLDLALLAVPGLRAPAVRLGSAERRVTIPVLRDGVRTALTGRVRRRVLIHWRDHPGDPPRTRPGLELDARIDPGDSGAPLIDRRGRLLGVLYARSSDRDGTAWAVDASAVRAVLDR